MRSMLDPQNTEKQPFFEEKRDILWQKIKSQRQMLCGFWTA